MMLLDQTIQMDSIVWVDETLVFLLLFFCLFFVLFCFPQRSEKGFYLFSIEMPSISAGSWKLVKNLTERIHTHICYLFALVSYCHEVGSHLSRPVWSQDTMRRIWTTAAIIHWHLWRAIWGAWKSSSMKPWGLSKRPRCHAKNKLTSLPPFCLMCT